MHRSSQKLWCIIIIKSHHNIWQQMGVCVCVCGCVYVQEQHIVRRSVFPCIYIVCLYTWNINTLNFTVLVCEVNINFTVFAYIFWIIYIYIYIYPHLGSRECSRVSWVQRDPIHMCYHMTGKNFLLCNQFWHMLGATVKNSETSSGFADKFFRRRFLCNDKELHYRPIIEHAKVSIIEFIFFCDPSIYRPMCD